MRAEPLVTEEDGLVGSVSDDLCFPSTATSFLPFFVFYLSPQGEILSAAGDSLSVVKPV